jgi:hypothetical protein
MSSLDGIRITGDQAIDVTSQGPIACNLPDRDREARGEEVEDLLSQAREVRELSDGYGFAFEANEEWASKLLAFIEVERQCCPFFVFEIVFESNYGPLWLVLRGSDQVKEFIEASGIRAAAQR